MDGQHCHEFGLEIWPWALALRTARIHPCFQVCFIPPGTHGDPPGQMTLGEGSIINGTGSQTAGGNRWGDYYVQSFSIRVDDMTFLVHQRVCSHHKCRRMAVANRRV